MIVEGIKRKFSEPRTYHDYVDDLLTRKAVQFLSESHTRPFCLFLWFYAPHAPFDRPLRMVNDFNGVAIPKPGSFDEYLVGYAGKPRGVIEESSMRATRSAHSSCSAMRPARSRNSSRITIAESSPTTRISVKSSVCWRSRISWTRPPCYGVPIMASFSASIASYEYYECPGDENVKPCRGVRTERYKYIHYFTEPQEFELYDLQIDPGEMRNLHGDLKYAALTAKLAARLQELRRETNDHYAYLPAVSLEDGQCT